LEEAKVMVKKTYFGKVIALAVMILLFFPIFTDSISSINIVNRDYRFIGKNYDYVIITVNTLEKSLTPFKTWKEIMGHSVFIANTSWIDSNFIGLDLEEKIRNFLIEKYIEWGIKFVLIIGNDFLIPMRRCYPNKNLHTDYDVVPTDYYYADLTGNWDKDGDGYYGEREDDSPDFEAEVYVGRIPYFSSSTVKKICQKTIDFQRDTGDWKKNALLLAAFFNFENQDHADIQSSDNAELMEELLVDVYRPNDYNCTTMYEKSGICPSIFDCDYPLTNENVLSFWLKGFGIVNWAAHGHVDSASRLFWDYDDGDGNPENDEILRPSFITKENVTLLNDEKPSIVFSCSCFNAYAESASLGSVLLRNGAVAFIGSTRNTGYNPGWENEEDGGMLSIDYYFFDYLINNKQTCGQALYNSKQYYKNNFDSHEGWWYTSCYDNLYNFCLYGDPSLSIIPFTNYSKPTNPQKPKGSIIGKTNIEYNFSTSSSHPDNLQLFYLWDYDNGNFSDWLGSYDSGEICEVSYIWKSKGKYNIRVKSKDIVGVESEWSDPLTVIMPKSKSGYSGFLRIVEWLMDRFPLLETFIHSIIL
jgi:hypothetical protein